MTAADFRGRVDAKLELYARDSKSEAELAEAALEPVLGVFARALGARRTRELLAATLEKLPNKETAKRAPRPRCAWWRLCTGEAEKLRFREKTGEWVPACVKCLGGAGELTEVRELGGPT